MKGDRRRVGCIIVSLDVSICERLVQAADDGLKVQLWVGTSESVGQDVSSGNLDGLLEKIVFEDDETGVQRRSIAENVFPIHEDLGSCDSSRMDVEVLEASVRLHTNKPKS